MLHVSNLIHLVYVVIAWSIVARYIRATRATRFRTTLRLVQIIAALFTLDILLGVFLIEALYDNTAVAGWVSKSVMFYPLLWLAALWFMWRVHRARKSP